MSARTETSPALVDGQYVADYLGLTIDTVHENCRKGRLPGIKFGHRWYFRRDRLEEMFDAPLPADKDA